MKFLTGPETPKSIRTKLLHFGRFGHELTDFAPRFWLRIDISSCTYFWKRKSLILSVWVIFVNLVISEPDGYQACPQNSPSEMTYFLWTENHEHAQTIPLEVLGRRKTSSKTVDSLGEFLQWPFIDCGVSGPVWNFIFENKVRRKWSETTAGGVAFLSI